MNQNQKKNLIEFITNYLDDFLFISNTVNKCNKVVHCFLAMCKDLGVSMSEEKTEWGNACMVFLGILLDGEKFILIIPVDK